MDPWQMALDAMFIGPGSAAAVFVRTGEPPRVVRVIQGRPDRTTGFADGQTILGTNQFEIRRSDVAEPLQHDVVVVGAVIENDAAVGGERFSLLGEAMLDLEGLTWTIGAEPA